jgi:tRNA nucleotidyltransferase (CCA-adding enzyme)
MMNKNEELKRVCEAVIERIRPNDTERKRIKAVTDSIIAKINGKALEMGQLRGIRGFVARRT